MAVASPPPMHSVAIPRLPPRLRNAFTNVTTKRAPDAPDRMTQCAGAAMHIDFIVRDAELLDRRHCHDGKRFVDFEQIHLVQLPAELADQRLDCTRPARW